MYILVWTHIWCSNYEEDTLSPEKARNFYLAYLPTPSNPFAPAFYRIGSHGQLTLVVGNGWGRVIKAYERQGGGVALLNA